MISQIENNTVAPNEQYSRLASDTQIMRTAQSLEAHGIHAIIAANGEETRTKLLELLPEGAEVFLGSSDTVKELGLKEIVDNSERFNSVRVRLAKMDSSTQNREMIKMGAVPEYIIGSVQAVTEDGSVVIASNTGSQLAPYAASAAHVIWVVGSQKIVRTLEEGFERVYQYALPLEDARLMKEYGMRSSVNKMLIIHKEVIPGRTTIILVKEKLGF
ncbi:MAG: LUD domain-containing protein [Anaerolineae bacterium]|jgi:L-lactate utilization protein LutC|nr:LUD domain-containing protein [Anaerolineae bacterium]